MSEMSTPKRGDAGSRSAKSVDSAFDDFAKFLPAGLVLPKNPQTALPTLAKDARATALIEDAIQAIPTSHRLFKADARESGLSKSLRVYPSTSLAKISLRSG